MTMLTANGTDAAALPAYPTGCVPVHLATAARLREEELEPGEMSEEVRGWLIEPTGTGAVLHTPLYDRDAAEPVPSFESADFHLRLEVGNARTWAHDMYAERRHVRIVGLYASACCGRLTEAAAIDLEGNVHFHGQAASPPGAACLQCASDEGAALDDFSQGLRRGMLSGQGTLIGWGLADALLLERTLASRQGRRWVLELEDAQQWNTEGNGHNVWSPTGQQYYAFPPRMKALSRCDFVLEMIWRLKSWKARNGHRPGDPILTRTAGSATAYGAVLLPRELALTATAEPSAAAVPVPRTGRPRSRLVAVEQHLTPESTWRSPEAEQRLQRHESALVQDFIAHLKSLGHAVSRHEIRPGGRAVLHTDVFDQTTAVLYEAKATAERGEVRMAIGQLLDYRHQLNIPDLRLAVLLPTAPSPDLRGLLDSLGISLVHRDGATFSAPTAPELLTAASRHGTLRPWLHDRGPVGPPGDG